MSESANDRASLGFLCLLLFTGTLVVVTGESVTLTSPIANITSVAVDYYWFSSCSLTRLPCVETDVSNNNCTLQSQKRDFFASIAVLDGIGFTVAVFTLNNTLQPRECECFSLFKNVSNNVTRVENSTGCPCDGSYLNQATAPDCNAAGNITQSPSSYDYTKKINVTFTCVIDKVKNDTDVRYQWTFYNSSYVQKRLHCQERVISPNCTVPGQAEFAGARVQCLAFTNVAIAPCISTPINTCNSNQTCEESDGPKTTINPPINQTQTCGAVPLGNDLGVYLHTLLAFSAWFVVSATWI